MPSVYLVCKHLERRYNFDLIIFTAHFKHHSLSQRSYLNWVLKLTDFGLIYKESYLSMAVMRI